MQSELKEGDKIISGPFTSLKKINDGDKVVLNSNKKGSKPASKSPQSGAQKG